jgi:hypothetical protein
MPQYKLSFLFSLQDEGWSENFYVTGSTPNAVINALPAPFLIQYTAMRASLAQLVAIRAVQDPASPVTGNPPRIGAVVPQVGAGVGIGAGVAEPTAVSAVCSLTALNGARRHIWLRGLPDASILRDANGFSVPSGSLAFAIQNLQAFFAVANQVNPGLSIRTLNNTPAPYTPQIVTTFVPSVTIPGATTCTAPGHGFVAGNWVRFTGLKPDVLPGFAGKFQVLAVTANTFDVGYLWRSQLSTVTFPRARVYALGYTYSVINGIAFQYFSTRDTGRPISQHRGRRPARVRRQ